MRKTNRACTNEPFDMLMGFWIVAEAERRVMRMYQAGLVLEGGGMKGVYTAGVLDFFTEKGIDFSHIYGVSAGACHMCSYLSRQKGRALSVSVDYLDTRRYCSLESLLTSGDLFSGFLLSPDPGISVSV